MKSLITLKSGISLTLSEEKIVQITIITVVILIANIISIKLLYFVVSLNSHR